MATISKKKEEGMVRISEVALRQNTEQIFITMGVTDSDARLAADVLIRSDLRGIESHGVSNMLRKYVRDYRNGKLKTNPEWKITRESPSTASIDADQGLGLIIAPKAMDIAIAKAKKTGVGMVTIKNAGHMGMVSYYPMMALSHGMIGSAMSATLPEVVPTFGAETRLGTNPIAVAAPTNTMAPFVFDAATSVVSNNKLGLARRTGVKLQAGWIADAEGTPIMHEVTPPPEVRGQANLLPLGGVFETGSHKGYGLGCVVDIMSGILAGAGFGAQLGRVGYSHTVIAYSIEAFMDVNEFKETMDVWLKTFNATKPAVGHDHVYYAGEMEAMIEKKNHVEGIPLHSEVVTWFREISKELSIEVTI